MSLVGRWAERTKDVSDSWPENDSLMDISFNITSLDSCSDLFELESHLLALSGDEFGHFCATKFPFKDVVHLAVHQCGSPAGDSALSCLDIALRSPSLSSSSLQAPCLGPFFLSSFARLSRFKSPVLRTSFHPFAVPITPSLKKCSMRVFSIFWMRSRVMKTLPG
jgi:hypothetical protein